MTPMQIRNARATLGRLWGMDRPLLASEFGRILGLAGRHPGATVLDWERGKAPISGPVSVAVEMMLAGARPPTLGCVLAEDDQ